jgi:hypothetical protein
MPSVPQVLGVEEILEAVQDPLGMEMIGLIHALPITQVLPVDFRGYPFALVAR